MLLNSPLTCTGSPSEMDVNLKTNIPPNNTSNYSFISQVSPPAIPQAQSAAQVSVPSATVTPTPATTAPLLAPVPVRAMPALTPTFQAPALGAPLQYTKSSDMILPRGALRCSHVKRVEQFEVAAVPSAQFYLISPTMSPLAYQHAGPPATPMDILLHPIIIENEANPEVIIVWRKSRHVDFKLEAVEPDHCEIRMTVPAPTSEIVSDLRIPAKLIGPTVTDRSIVINFAYPPTYVHLSNPMPINTEHLVGIHATLN